MARCIIFCAAEFDGRPVTREEGDLVIAADGGLAHTRVLGMEPDEILGDFDSLGYVPEDSRVFPVEKDDTDAMLAVRRGLELGYREFWLYGSLDGPRLDHTVANFQTLRFLADRGARGFLLGNQQTVTAVKAGSLRFSRGTGDLSVFCMGDRARGVTLRGVKYPLEAGELTCGFPLGVSNRFQGEKTVVSVAEGCLLVIWDRNAGLPEFGPPLP